MFHDLIKKSSARLEIRQLCNKVRYLLRFIFPLFFLTAFSPLQLHSEELDSCVLNNSLPLGSYHISGELIDLDGILFPVKILWKHGKITDTFRLTSSRPDKELLTYSSSTEKDLLFIGEKRIPRQMAAHHRRERIWNTLLRWEDLKSLQSTPKGRCQEKIFKNEETELSFYPNQATTFTRYRFRSFSASRQVHEIQTRSRKGLEFRFVNLNSYKKLAEVWVPNLLSIYSEKHFDGGMLVLNSFKASAPQSPQEDVPTLFLKSLID